MAVDKGLVSKAALTAIGDAIREKNKTTTQYKPSEMATAISNLKTGDFTVATSDKFNFKVVQSANQIIKSTPTGGVMNNSDGTVSVALMDTTTISPNTNYIPGAVQRSYDDSTHTYTVTATDAEPIDGLVQDGWSVVYQKSPSEDRFYPNANYTGNYQSSYKLQGNILIGGMQKHSTTSSAYPDTSSNNISKFKNTFITSVGSYLSSCKSLIYAELPNLTKATGFSLLNYALITYIELPSLVTGGPYLLQNCDNLRSVELPRLTAVDVGLLSSVRPSTSSPMHFVDFGYITENINADIIQYARVVVLKANTVPTRFIRSSLSDPVLYIVPSSLVDTYKSKVRSTDYVTALEKSPFADGKTVCGNNMKTVYQSRSEIWLGEGTSMVWHASSDEWMYDTYYPQSDDNSGDQAVPSVANVMRAPEPTDESFRFFSKLTKEQGYTIPT